MLGFRGDNGGKIPVLLDVVQWKGGRGVDLEDEIARYPGVYDLYKANPQNRWEWCVTSGSSDLSAGSKRFCFEERSV